MRSFTSEELHGLSWWWRWHAGTFGGSAAWSFVTRRCNLLFAHLRLFRPSLSTSLGCDIETGDYTEAQSMEEVVIWLLGSECGCFLLWGWAYRVLWRDYKGQRGYVCCGVHIKTWTRGGHCLGWICCPCWRTETCAMPYSFKWIIWLLLKLLNSIPDTPWSQHLYLMNAVVCWRISGRFLLSIVIGNQIMHVLAQQGRADPPPLVYF